MDKKIFVIGILSGLLGLMCLIGYYHYNHEEAVSDTVRICVYDTIRYYSPVPKDSVLIRYVTKVVPQYKDSVIGVTAAAASDESDSVAVVLPITQKVYTDDSTYTAYISGYEQTLDSILIRNRSVLETVTITETKTKDYPLGIGITAGAGYGFINKKPDIFVGLSVYYRIWPRKGKR